VALSIIMTMFSSSMAMADPYGNCIAAKLNPSLGVIAQMTGDKLDLSHTRQVSQLFLGENEALKSARPELLRLGYAITEQSGGRLLAVQSFSVSKAWVGKVIPQMCKIATDASIEYDGWDIDVAADHITSDKK